MVKFLLISSLLFSLANIANATGSVLACATKIEIDQGQYDEVGITIYGRAPGYISFLMGSNESGPIQTKMEVVSFRDSMKIFGIQPILNKSKIPRNIQQKIKFVRIYTAGNFMDDLAGARAAQFLDRNYRVLGAGMYLGWAGPFTCSQN